MTLMNDANPVRSIKPMTHVVFRNDSVIDKRAITIMGVSSKDGPSAIGFFGTD